MVALVGLLHPQRDRLRDEFLQLDIVPHRKAIDGVRIISAQHVMADHALRQQNIVAQRRAELEQAALLVDQSLAGNQGIQSGHGVAAL
jgi:hypothetical protein